MNLKDIEKLKYDSRMVDINMKSEILSEAELQKHLEKLPDLAGSCVQLDIEHSSSDTDDLNSSAMHHQ